MIKISGSELRDFERCPEYRRNLWDRKRKKIAEPSMALELGKWAHEVLAGMMRGIAPSAELPWFAQDAKARALKLALEAWWQRYSAGTPWTEVLQVETALEVPLCWMLRLWHEDDLRSLQMWKEIKAGQEKLSGMHSQRLRIIQKNSSGSSSQWTMPTLRPEIRALQNLSDLPKEGQELHGESGTTAQARDVHISRDFVYVLWRIESSIPRSGSSQRKNDSQQAKSRNELQTSSQAQMVEGSISSTVHELQLGPGVSAESYVSTSSWAIAIYEEVRLVGIPDAIVRWQNQIYHVQHKTVDQSQSISNLILSVAQSLHESIYAILIKSHLPYERYGGTMLNVVRKMSEKAMKEESTRALHLEWIPIAERQLDRAKHDIKLAVQNFDLDHRRRTSCVSPGAGVCGYYDACWNGISLSDNAFYEDATPNERYLDAPALRTTPEP